MATDETAELAAIARELYGVVPAEFVGARNTRVAQLRQAGERVLATRVKALPKATASAWAVGAVSRHAPDELDALGELGAELRVAQRLANPAELRVLSRRRRELTAAVSRAALRLAQEHDVVLSPAALEQVTSTWQAVVTDPFAERVVRTCQLVRTLEPGEGDPRSALAVAAAVEAARAEEEPEKNAAGVHDELDEPDGEPEEPDGELEEPDGELEEPDEPDEPDGESDESDEPDEPADPPARRRTRPAPRKAAASASGTGGRSGGASRTATDGREPARLRVTGEEDDEAGDASSSGRGDVAREVRRLRRDLRFRERAAQHAREELDDAADELTRVEAEILQVAARLEELRREVAAAEDELEGLDDERVAAAEEREDAEERTRVADAEVAEIRERLAELE